MGFWNIVFTNPALAAAGVALFVPYLVHLLTRRTPRRLVFPTVRFIRKAEASHSRLFRLRDVLLLLLRTAFVLLIFLAFLKPVLRAQAARRVESAGRTVTVVLDASMSMGYSGTGFTPFARGQLAATRIIDRLGPADVANVIVAGSSPVTSFETPASNAYHLKRDLQTASATLARADFDAAIAEGVRQSELSDRHKPLFYFISDFQRTNWASVDFARLPEDAETVFVPVNETRPWNLAITEITVEPPAPVVSEDIEIACTIANYGGAPEEIPVTLSMDEANDQSGGQEPPTRTTLERRVSVPGGDSATAAFRIRPRESGIFEGTVRIAEDGLSADNTRYFTLRITDRVDVLLVTEQQADDERTAVHFLARAMEPLTRNDTLGTLRTSIVPQAAFTPELAASAQLTVLEEPGPFTELMAKALAQYLRDGGAVLYVLSQAADGVNLQMMEDATQRALQLPFSLDGVIDYRASQPMPGFAIIAEANFDEPMLRRFRENNDLGSAHFTRVLATERIGGQGQVLMRYNDGNIALARTSYGAGTLLLCNMDVSREGSDFARKTVFVPFVHELLKGMRPSEGTARASLVGQPASAPAALMEGGGDVLFTNPLEEAVTATVSGQGEHTSALFPHTSVPGFYRLREGSRTAGVAAVNIDARESDLNVLSEEQLHELVRASRRTSASVSGDDPQSLEQFLEGLPLWPWLLIAALVIFGIEQALLLVLRR
ncbi:MAG: BatA and WFA domain-containing protein [Candidatus Hydrogenedentes bacterium]|nr:BatA and WFA domain-containing protein [Candidatus Hydrogenedentota bacterium]